MEVFLIYGFICGVIAAPFYSLIMLWLGRWQRVYVAVLVGALLLASSVQILKTQQLGVLSAGQVITHHFGALFFLALTIGWLVCSFFHAIISLLRGWGTEHAPDATPQPVQD